MSSKPLRLLLFFFCLSACKSETKEKEVPLHFETETVVKKSGEGCLSDDFNCTVISLEIPQAQGPEEATQKINSVLKKFVIDFLSSEENPSATYEDLAKEFIANRQKVESDFAESAPWKALIYGRIYSQSPNLISIGMDSEIFTGGAHGYRSTKFLNFNPQTGDQYQHNDLFTPEFTEYVEQEFRRQQEIPEGENINSTGFWFENESFNLPTNIGFENDKVILVYNAYEIASYADGEMIMEFPEEEVQQYIKLEQE